MRDLGYVQKCKALANVLPRSLYLLSSANKCRDPGQNSNKCLGHLNAVPIKCYIFPKYWDRVEYWPTVSCPHKYYLCYIIIRRHFPEIPVELNSQYHPFKVYFVGAVESYSIVHIHFGVHGSIYFVVHGPYLPRGPLSLFTLVVCGSYYHRGSWSIFSL